MVNSPIISLTTIPDRIDYIEPCVRSLLAQGFPVYIWAVRKIPRSSTVLTKLPSWLKECQAIVEFVEDVGPITKLLPALERGFKVIITADDDRVYGKDWARKLLWWAGNKPRCAIALRGRILTGKGYGGTKLVVHNKLRKPRRVDIITGVRGAVYRSEFFDEGIYREWKRCSTNDDLVIAAHFKRRRIRSLVVPVHVRIRSLKLQHVMPLFKVNRSKDDKVNTKWLKVLGLE